MNINESSVCLYCVSKSIKGKISCSSRKLIKDMQAEIDYLNDRQGKGTPRRGLTPRAGAPRQQSPRYGVTRTEILVKVFAFSWLETSFRSKFFLVYCTVLSAWYCTLTFTKCMKIEWGKEKWKDCLIYT